MNTQGLICVKNPGSGELASRITINSDQEIKEAVVRARKAQKAWGALPPKERHRYFLRLREEIIKNQDEIIKTIQLETAKTLVDAITEVVYICGAILYFAKSLKEKHDLSKKETPLMLANKLALSANEPWPVVGMISPWNLPLTLSFGEAIPYLMMGSAVVLKPSEWTPLSAIHMEKLCHRVGIPQDVFQVIIGYGEAGASLVESGVDYLSFTGSTKTGRKIAERCGQLLKPYSLELGGKTPFLMLENLSGGTLERAISCALWSAFANTGQYCKSTERIYVAKKHADYVISSLVKLASQLRPGKDFGPIITPFQVDIVGEHVRDAVSRGARVFAGGKEVALDQSTAQWCFNQPGLQWVCPTVLTNVNHSMKIMREETFGPAVSIMVVKDDDEAIELANDSKYGLNAVVFSNSIKRSIEVAKQIQAGTITVNDALINYMTPALPYGGVKDSGWGRRHGTEGGWETARQKSIFIHRFPFPFRNDLWWFPYTNKTEWLLKLLTRWNRFFARW